MAKKKPKTVRGKKHKPEKLRYVVTERESATEDVFDDLTPAVCDWLSLVLSYAEPEKTGVESVTLTAYYPNGVVKRILGGVLLD